MRVVGDSAVIRAHREWANAWLFKHPSPWDYMFFMNRALKQDLGWFWYSWLFTTESVDGSIQNVTTAGTRRQREELHAQAVRLAALGLLHHAFQRQAAEDAMRRGLRQSSLCGDLGQAQAFARRVGQRADDREAALQSALRIIGIF